MAADSSSFLPSSGNTGSGSLLKTPKSPARSRFSKALPAPPPVPDKMLPTRSSSRPTASVDLTDNMHSLPPLPSASSAVPSSSNYSYIPTSSTPATLSASPASAATTAALPPPPPKSSARPLPGTVTSAKSPSLSLFPHHPPPPPSKTAASPVLPTPAQAPAIPSRAIRRRPVASSVSVASSDSNRSLPGAASPPPQAPAASAPSAAVLPSVSSLPQLPDLPSFNSFSSLSELPGNSGSAPSGPSVLPELPELSSMPADADASSSSETQSQTKTVRGPSPPPPPAAEETSSSSRVASISSILSAYSEASSTPAGLSSSNSAATVSTNTSSVMAASSPLRLLPGDESQHAFLDVHKPGSGGKLDEDVHTPLSYLLDGDYADEDEVEVVEKDVAKEGSVVANAVSQSYSNNSDEYDPYSDAYYSYKPPVPRTPKKNDTAATAVVRVDNQTTNGLNNASAPPPPISMTEATALPPRSTSLRNLPPDVMSKTVTSATGALKPDDSLPPLPSLPQHSSSPSEIWKRRSEKAETNLSVTELQLKSTPALQNAIAVAVAADVKADNPDAVQHQQLQDQQNLQTQKQDLPPVAPAKDGGYLAYRQPLPPPQSPLPPPPSRSGLNQLQPPRSPLTDANANGVSPSSLAPSPRLGLPGRDIRPSRQASPALTPTAPQTGAAQPSSNMGTSLTKLETKVESSFKRKNLPASASVLPPPPPAKELQPTAVPTAVQSPLTSKPQPPPPPPSFQRPPTPEYDDEDGENSKDGKPYHSRDGASIAPSMMGTVGTSSSSATVVNVPVSPAASPAGSATSTSARPPFTEEPVSSHGSFEPIASPQQQRQNSPLPLNGSGLVGRDIRPVKSVSRLNNQDVSSTNNLPPVPVQPQPKQQFAPRTSSRNVSISTVPGVLPGLVQPSKQMPTTVPEHQYGNSAVSSVSETGSQVTIKPVTQKAPLANGLDRHELSPTNDDAARPLSSTSEDLPMVPGMPPLFPTGYMTDVVTPDSVFAAPPPSTIQFNCLQRHNDMFRDRNVNYPLSCQACQTFERSMRWRCKWCYLRICSNCRDSLHTHAKHDLARLMTFIEEGDAKDAAMDEEYARDGNMAAVHSISSASELPVIQEA
ncbi:hypothetical protein SBRCBS47491_003572 [Sporothrix bragantina]|uniref:Uncharacterized protein n=1 Tax=Sporothrix bragantina TaxID=671064 RepID=A0ABP0BGC0_9PEZI